MANKQPARLKILRTFSVMVSPRTEQARKEMEERLLQYGCNMPIRVWNNTVLVDQEEYLFCRAHDIPLNIKGMRFRNQEEAIVWICKNQLRRADLVTCMRKYLIGRRLQAERALLLQQASKMQNNADEENAEMRAGGSGIMKLIERISAEYHVSTGTIRRYDTVAAIIDQLMTIEPVLCKKLLRGQIKLSFDNLIEIADMSSREISNLTRYFLDGSNNKVSFPEYKESQKQNTTKTASQTSSLGAIKEMPEYDPDAEVSSLALTVPSWVDSIHRTESGTDLKKISERARERLICELDRLAYTVEGLLSILKEDSYG